MSAAIARLRRRAFLAALGLGAGGLALGLSSEAAAQGAPTTPPARPSPAGDAGPAGLRPGVFVHIAASGVVTIVCHRSEMGQGVRSTIPTLIADEMGADVPRVKIVQGDGDAAYGDQNTDGSKSIRGQLDDLRRIGATARVMLITAAAKRWKVKPETCDTRDGQVLHAASKRALPFGVLADEAGKLAVPRKEAVSLRPWSELRHVGKGMPLLDGPDIVTGRAIFGADVKLPGMLTAVVARPPVAGGKVARFDATRALAVPGVKKVVELPAPKLPFAFQPLGGVAVIAENTWAALRGRAALEVTWDHGANAAYDSDAYRAAQLRAVAARGKPERTLGDVDKALAGAARTVSADYVAPHLAHASMEPPVAVARIDGDKVEVWAPTQHPQAAQKEVARAMGVDPRHVTIHVTLLGGGFGRKSKPDFVAEAALLARAAGAPVRVQWTRTDDLQHDYYHSVSAQRIEAGLDAAGKVVAWRQRIAFPPIPSIFNGADRPSEGELGLGILDLPLAVPNLRFESCESKAHTRIGWLRSVANVYHAFAVQSFADELAHARGKDPRDNLLELLGPPRVVGPAELGVAKVPNYGASLDEHPVDVGRHRRVLERVTELAGWADRGRSKRALGLAVHRSFLTYVAVVASVVKDASGRLRVDEAWLVADAGRVVNLERVRSQMEGAVIFGMSLALHGAITMKAGATTQTNFRDHKLVRMAEAPRKVHVEVISSDGAPGGVGEPGVPPVAPAIANAVFALTGKRARELPLARTFAI